MSEKYDLFEGREKQKSSKLKLQKSKKKSPENIGVWKILVVDDEESVHSATNIILDGVKFLDKNIEIISAYSAIEAKKILEENLQMKLRVCIKQIQIKSIQKMK